MTDTAHPLAPMQAPPWAETCTRSEEAVIHSRVLGQAVNLDGRDLLIELVQRDELTVSENAVSITRHPACLRLGGEMSPVMNAAHLATLLTSAPTLPDRRPTPHRAAPGGT